MSRDVRLGIVALHNVTNGKLLSARDTADVFVRLGF